MSEEGNAARSIDQLQRLFGGLLEIKPELLTVDALKQQAAEAEGRKAAAERDAEQARAVIREREGHIERTKGVADKLLADARAEANQIIETAQQSARRVGDAAMATAERVQLAAQETRQKAETDLAAARQEVRQAKAEAATARRERDSINAEIAALKQRLGA